MFKLDYDDKTYDVYLGNITEFLDTVVKDKQKKGPIGITGQKGLSLVRGPTAGSYIGPTGCPCCEAEQKLTDKLLKEMGNQQYFWDIVNSAHFLPFLKKTIERVDINSYIYHGNDGWSFGRFQDALNYHVENRNLMAVKNLIACGISRKNCFKGRCSEPLSIAVNQRNIPMIKYLIQFPEFIYDDYQWSGETNLTPSTCYHRYQDFELCDILLNVGCADNRTSRFLNACKFGCFDYAKKEMKADNFDINQLDKNRNNCLQLVLSNASNWYCKRDEMSKNIEISRVVDFLNLFCEDPNFNINKVNPLLHTYKNKTAIQILVNKGANINYTNYMGKNMINSNCYDCDFVEFLVCIGADINIKDNYGDNFFVRTFLKNDKKGWSSTDEVDLLYQTTCIRGFDILSKNKKGKNIQDIIYEMDLFTHTQVDLIAKFADKLSLDFSKFSVQQFLCLHRDNAINKIFGNTALERIDLLKILCLQYAETLNPDLRDMIIHYSR